MELAPRKLFRIRVVTYIYDVRNKATIPCVELGYIYICFTNLSLATFNCNAYVMNLPSNIYMYSILQADSFTAQRIVNELAGRTFNSQ